MARVLVLATACPAAWILIRELRRNFDVVDVVIESKEPAWIFIRRRIRKFGWLKTLGQIAFQVYGKFAAIPCRGLERAYLSRAGLDDRPLAEGEFKRVGSVNDPQALELIRSLQPDVILVCGTRIIRAATLERTKATFLNAHYGVTPRYRGVHGGYWALAQKDAANCGVTVHVVDPGVDTGTILYQSLIKPGPSDNFFTYPTLQAIVATPLLVRAARDCVDGKAQPGLVGVGPSKQWYHPTLFEYLRIGLQEGVW
jgi:folate-dependent phosphoribosylglycinamide formyltransferase PurN